MKKSNLIVFFVAGTSFIIGTSFLLRLEPVKKYLREHDSDYQREISCFTIMPYKCGPGYDASDKQIVEEIRWLKLSKDEARDLVLKAMQEDAKKFEILKNKESLNEFEEFKLSVREDVKNYQERVLKIIDQME